MASVPKDVPPKPTSQADDALLHAVRSILVGQERNQLEELEQKIAAWQHQVEISERDVNQRVNDIFTELKNLKEVSQSTAASTREVSGEVSVLRIKSQNDAEGLIERLTPVMTALIKRTIQDSPYDMAEALGPVMGSAIRQQIRTQKDDIIDALYPVIGETISKSVAESISELVRHIDRRNKPHARKGIFSQIGGGADAEMLFRNNLPYEILRVFLIHRPSGLLLAQISSTDTEEQDLDIISGMLTAIRDFVRDSFGDQGELGEIKHGEQRILLQSSQNVYIAAVVNGTVPNGYNALMRQAVSEMNMQHEETLRTFDGNMDSIPDLNLELTSLLEPSEQLEAEEAALSSKQKKTLTAIIVAILVFLSFSIFSCVFTVRLWPYAFPPPLTVTPTHTFTPEPTQMPTLTPMPTATRTPTPTATATLLPEQGIAVGNVNIRQGPSVDYPVLDILYNNESFIILDEETGWLYIRREVTGKPIIEGWVNQLWVQD